MTRTAAREIAIQLEYRMSLNRDDPAQALDEFFQPEYFRTLAGEDRLFAEYPDEKQLSYIRKLVQGVSEHREELNAAIEKYARNWKVGRISKIAASIIRTAMYEIRYMDEDDVPDAAAINEAVQLAKGYEEPETVAFINGVLGSFVREERGLSMDDLDQYLNLDSDKPADDDEDPDSDLDLDLDLVFDTHLESEEDSGTN